MPQAGFEPPPVDDTYEADALPTKPPRLVKNVLPGSICVNVFIGLFFFVGIEKMKQLQKKLERWSLVEESKQLQKCVTI